MADVRDVLDGRQKEIQRLRERIAELEGLGGKRRVARRPAASRRKAKRSRRKLTTQARSRLRLQGKYMGYVRRLTATQKAEVRKLRQEKGWRAATRMAAGLVKRIGGSKR